MDSLKQAIPPGEIGTTVARVVRETPVVDMHTHLYSEQFGSIGLWGLDELINYHYLIAEIFRFSPISWPQAKSAYWTTIERLVQWSSSARNHH